MAGVYIKKKSFKYKSTPHFLLTCNSCLQPALTAFTIYYDLPAIKKGKK